MSALIEREVPLEDEIVQDMEKVVQGCITREGLDDTIDVNIVITNNEEIHKLNRQFRQVDRPTDVLSFPAYELDETFSRAISRGIDLERDEQTGNIFLGDLIISLEKAREQSLEYGHSLLREMCFLTAHGMFHLLGYDHQTALEEQVMLKRQNEVLERLSICR